MIEPPTSNNGDRADRLEVSRIGIATLILAALLIGVIAGGTVALLITRNAEINEPTAATSAERSLADAVRTAAPFAVALTTLGAPSSPGTATANPERLALGTGTVLDLEGHILTTGQVIKQYDEVQVVFYDGQTTSATLVGLDDETGLAVLKANTTVPYEPTYIRSSQLTVGEQVLSLGTSLVDLKRTVGQGIVGATGRRAKLRGDQPVDNLIQTDAIAPDGFLGGPVINTKGQIVGMSIANGGANDEWAMVLPSETVRAIARRLISDGAGPRASLGIYYVTVTPQLAELRGLKQSGALITAVIPRSPAARKGLRPGDLIISLNGKVVNENQTFESLLAAYRPGQKVKLQVVRNDLVVNHTIVLARKPAPAAAPSPTPDD